MLDAGCGPIDCAWGRWRWLALSKSRSVLLYDARGRRGSGSAPQGTAVLCAVHGCSFCCANMHLRVERFCAAMQWFRSCTCHSCKFCSCTLQWARMHGRAVAGGRMQSYACTVELTHACNQTMCLAYGLAAPHVCVLTALSEQVTCHDECAKVLVQCPVNTPPSTGRRLLGRLVEQVIEAVP